MLRVTALIIVGHGKIRNVIQRSAMLRYRKDVDQEYEQDKLLQVINLPILNKRI